MHKNCGKDCDNHECRAFFPERQPIISKLTKDICTSDDYDTECLHYIEGTKWREEKRLQGLKEKCPFATNNVCGRSWSWRCDAVYPFKLNPYEIREGTDDIPVRDEDRNIKFIPLKTDEGEDFDLHATCLSGDPEIYMPCPIYKDGVKHREYVEELKSKEK